MQESIVGQDRFRRFTMNALQTVLGLTNTVQAISSVKIAFKGYILNNADSSSRWVQIFFRPSTEVTLGTTAPDLTLQIGPTSTVALDFENVFMEGTGFSAAATTTETGTTAPTNRITGTILYSI